MFESQTNQPKIANKDKISQLQQKLKRLGGLEKSSNLQSQDISFTSQSLGLNLNNRENKKLTEPAYNLKQVNSPSNKSYLNHQNQHQHQQNFQSKNQSLNFNNFNEFNSPSPLSPNSLHNNSNLKMPKQTTQKTDLTPLQAKYNKIQQKFVKFKLQQENLIHNIEREIIEVNDQVKLFKRDCERMQMKNQQVSEQLQRQLNVQISQMNQQIKELKKGVINSIDTKYKTIKTQMMAHIYQEFQVACHTASEELGQQIQTLQKVIQDDKNIRDQVSQLLINTFGDEILKLQQALNLQRQTRQHKNSQILDMISKLQTKLDSQITKQKKQTNSHIELLQNTLQQVCYKIQQKILGR